MKKSLGLMSRIVLLGGVLGSMLGCASATPVEEVPYVSQKVNLATEMQTIAANVKAFHQAQDTAHAKVALTHVRTAVERSQYVVPKSIDLADTAKIAAYANDLTAMLKIIDQAVILVDANKLSDAKTTLQQLDAIKDRAHKTYR